MNVKKILAVAVILLFFGINVNISTAIDTINKFSIPNSYGNTLYVGGYGQGNFSKIQDAIDNATDGDTVFVFDLSSPYIENVIINKSISLQGESKYTTTINGGGRGDAIYCEADNIKISGFTIKYGFRSQGSWWIAGIQLRLCNSCSIYDNIITENFHGIRLYGAEGNTISNNTISLSQRRGIWVHDLCHNTTISRNKIENCTYSGVSIDYSDNCIVNSNVVKYCEEDGISLNDAAFNKISNNKLYENSYTGIILRDSHDNEISFNSFFKCGLLIWQTYSYNNSVEHNLIDNKPLVYLEDEEDKIIDDAGQVVLLSCYNITVKDLNISNVFYGIQSYDTSNCIFTNNTIKNCYNAIYIGRHSPYVPENYIITKNQIIENFRGIYIRFSYYIEISDNYIFKNKESAINVTGVNYKISGNTIHTNLDGIFIKGSKHTIEGNIIENNIQAIFAKNFDQSKISRNDINYNDNGIFLEYSEYNIISKNNIYKSYYKDAFFKDSFLNRWRRNYWNKLIGPKIIPGAFYYYPGHYAPPEIIPVFRLDLRPARIRYKI